MAICPYVHLLVMVIHVSQLDLHRHTYWLLFFFYFSWSFFEVEENVKSHFLKKKIVSILIVYFSVTIKTWQYIRFCFYSRLRWPEGNFPGFQVREVTSCFLHALLCGVSRPGIRWGCHWHCRPLRRRRLRVANVLDKRVRIDYVMQRAFFFLFDCFRYRCRWLISSPRGIYYYHYHYSTFANIFFFPISLSHMIPKNRSISLQYCSFFFLFFFPFFFFLF